MNASGLALVLFLGAVTSADSTGEPTSDVDCSTGGRTETEIDLCAAADADKARKSLDDLLAALEAKLSPSEWKALRSVQDEWRRFAEHQCAWEASLFEGGSVAPATRSFCRRTLAKQRIEVLKMFLCEGAGMTGPCEESKRF